MSKEKFVFEWKVGDEVECKSSGQVSVVSNEWFSNANGNYKPHGETKIRYKAEKLAWQQSHMKGGDWVKRMKKHRVPELGPDFNGEPFQLGMSSGVGTYKGLGADYHAVQYLKPCKPPKEKVNLQIEAHSFTADSIREALADIERLGRELPEPPLASKNFKIEDGRLVYKSSGPRRTVAFDCGEITSNIDGQCATAWGRGLLLTSDRHREIANLLDRSTAKRRS